MTKECDFETVNICGWSSDVDNDSLWTKKNGYASYELVSQGPVHDHTVS